MEIHRWQSWGHRLVWASWRGHLTLVIYMYWQQHLHQGEVRDNQRGLRVGGDPGRLVGDLQRGLREGGEQHHHQREVVGEYQRGLGEVSSCRFCRA